MKISIITACYNSVTTLESTFQSVINQTYLEIEYIIVDGGSIDGSLQQIENCDFVSHYISEPDKGIYDALNKGVKLATGDVIGFLHSDDVFADNQVISKIANQFERCNVDGVYGDLQYVDKQNTSKVIRNWVSCKFELSLLKNGWMPAHPTLFIKKEVYEKYGSFNLVYKIAADYDFMLRIFSDNTLNFSYIPKVITKMRTGGASNRSVRNIILKTIEDYRIIRSHNIGGLFSILIKNISKIKQFILK